METSSTTNGRFAPPFTATELHFHTAAGQVTADITWSGTATLQAQLVCGTASASQTGGAGLFVGLTAPAGACSLDLSEALPTDVVVTYTVFLTRQAPAGGSDG